MQFKIKNNNCIFCQIINKVTAASILYEDTHCIAIKDLYPQAKQHLLIIPKKHIESLNSFEKEDYELLPQLFEVAQKLSLQFGFQSNGYRTVINNQAAAGQSIFHLHLHVLGGEQLGGKFSGL